MVGTPRSSGCETCRIRRKKCGEERPQCRACVAAGWKCPGYVRRWKFVDENEQLAAHYRQKRYIFEEVDLAPVPTAEDVHVHRNDISPDFNAEEEHTSPSASGGYRLPVGVFRALTSEDDHNGAFLMHVLEEPKNQSIFPLRAQGNYFMFIPSRLGRNRALDAAVSCLCAMYNNTLMKSASTAQMATRRYVKGLESLRLCLEDPQLRLESETICASILLQLCELLSNRDNGRWNHLCRGSKLLIQERGPASFADPFERAMLESQRAWFILQDVHAGKRCFLSEAPWRELLQQPAASPVTQGPLSIPLRSQLCDLLVDILELVVDASQLDQEQSSLLHQTGYNRTLSRILVLHRSLVTWYGNHFEPLLANQSNERQSSGTDETEASIEYPEILFAVLDSVSNLALWMLEEVYAALAAVQCRHGSLQLTICSPTITARRAATVRVAREFVRRNSPVAAQPLEFGLKQIWSSAMSLMPTLSQSVLGRHECGFT